MSKTPYERPSIVRNPVGPMNKVGRAGPPRAAAEVDGVSINALCEQFGSPLFVFSERRIRARVAEAKAAFEREYPNTRLCWSYKTNYLDAICSIFRDLGSLSEVVSGMEYQKARRIGVPGRDIIFNGPAKTNDELERAIREGAIIHADHFEEIYALSRIASSLHMEAVVGIRVGLDAGIHPRWDRFGFDLEGGQALEAVRRIVNSGSLKFGGLHTHIGTFVLDPAAYGRSATKLAAFAQEIERSFGIKVTHLDLGGGFASNNTLSAQYHSGALAPPISEYADEITRALKRAYAGVGPTPPLLIESGRALIDDAGTLLASVIASKRMSNGKRALIIDAGVNLLFTAWWYRLGITSARPPSAFLEDTVVYGPLCMNIDCVRESIPLPDLQAGEHLAIHPAGAYTFTQSMQFIKLRPACVLINERGEAELIRRAETLEDLVSADIVPERLRRSAEAEPKATARVR